VFFADGQNRVRFVVSQRVTLNRAVMAQGFIKSSTRREIATFYKSTWLPFVKGWIAKKRGNLVLGEGFKDAGGVGALGVKESEQAVVPAGAGGVAGADAAAGSARAWMAAWVALGGLSVLALLLLRLLFVIQSLEQRLERLEEGLGQ
jgi:hypothetical protein